MNPATMPPAPTSVSRTRGLQHQKANWTRLRAFECRTGIFNNGAFGPSQKNEPQHIHCRCRFVDKRKRELISAAVSNDGKLVAAGGEGVLLVFDRKTGEQVAAFEDAHNGAVAQVTPCGD